MSLSLSLLCLMLCVALGLIYNLLFSSDDYNNRFFYVIRSLALHSFPSQRWPGVSSPRCFPCSCGARLYTWYIQRILLMTSKETNPSQYKPARFLYWWVYSFMSCALYFYYLVWSSIIGTTLKKIFSYFPTNSFPVFG